MALAQASVASSKLILVVGAGLAGSVLVKNGRVTEFVSDVKKVFTKYFSEEKKDTSSGEGSDITAALTAQVNRLTQELRQLAGQRTITLVNGSPSQSGSLSNLAMPVIIVGIAGYGYFWWKGLSWTDIMYVTRRNMTNAVASVTKQLEQVSSALAATKRHLTSRIDNVNKALNENAATTCIIKDEVFELRTSLTTVGGDVVLVKRNVEVLEDKLDQVQLKQDFANRGIIMLCNFVESLEPGKRPELLQGLHPKGHLERSISAIPGLKDLQFITDGITSGNFGSLQKHRAPSLPSGVTGIL